MNTTNKQFVDFINKSIHSKKIQIDECKNVKWEEIVELAKPHKVEALIYSALSNEAKSSIDKEILESWKKNTFLSGIIQQNHIREVERILNIFSQNLIEVLVLKGLVIRDLYPNPSLRTMSDADIVVSEENIEKSIEILESLGYREIERSPSHFVYYRQGCLPIELHWNLADEHFFKQITLFEEDMKKNLEDIKFGSVDVKNMSLEDLAIYQCIHMAKHIVYRGFGIRHLIDFTLLVEKRGQEIGWVSFMDRCKTYGIYKFVVSVFLACKELFGLEIPKDIDFIDSLDKKYLGAFIEDIFESGVHGKHDFVSSVASEFAYTADKDGQDNESSFKRYMRFLFPKVKNMSERYDYAKKFKVLTPIAWIHHIFMGVFNKDYSLKDKIKFTTATVGISKKRNDLINWLEL